MYFSLLILYAETFLSLVLGSLGFFQTRSNHTICKLKWFLSLPNSLPHSSTLAWEIPWTDEPGRLQSMGSRRVRHDWVTSLSLFTFMHWRRKWQPTPVFLPGESHGAAWWAAVYGVAQSWTRLTWLSSSNSLHFSFSSLWLDLCLQPGF